MSVPTESLTLRSRITCPHGSRYIASDLATDRDTIHRRSLTAYISNNLALGNRDSMFVGSCCVRCDRHHHQSIATSKSPARHGDTHPATTLLAPCGGYLPRRFRRVRLADVDQVPFSQRSSALMSGRFCCAASRNALSSGSNDMSSITSSTCGVRRARPRRAQV